jgi:predicted HTH domain antitoxin
MTITIADNVIRQTQFSEKDLLIELAVALYQQEKITLMQGAEIADINLIAFQKELAQRNLTIHYDLDDLATDLKNLAN